MKIPESSRHDPYHKKEIGGIKGKKLEQISSSKSSFFSHVFQEISTPKEPKKFTAIHVNKKES